MQRTDPMKCYILVKDTQIKVQEDNIAAAATVSSIIKTCLGPRAMQKMVITKMGSLEITNDGNSILREIDVVHPAAKTLIELARTQDEEVGDGTTSVIILTTEILQKMLDVLYEGIHPINVCNVMNKALNMSIEHLNKIAIDVPNSEEEKLKIIKSSVNTKLCSILGVKVEELALKAVKAVLNEGKCDIKSYVKTEKILGDFKECEVLDGIILNKNIIHSQMRKTIKKPRVIILDCPLEYKKGESQTNLEFYKEEDFTRALVIEEEQVKNQCEKIIALKPDVVVTEKGISDLAMSIFYSNNITALRRLKKTESNRLGKVTGATVISRAEELEEKHIGKECGLFEYIKIGDEYYCKFTECSNPKACSVLIRGPSADIMNELERNFYDAVKIARNVFMCPKLCPGGGATEASLAKNLEKSSFFKNSTEKEKSVLKGLADALRMIPSILVQNSGAPDCLKIISLLEKKQEENSFFGINGLTGEVVDVRNIVMEPILVKLQCIKSAFETAMLLLRVDGVIQSMRKK